MIGKEISLSPSLPNRADCSPEVEFILNEEREREREREHRTSMDVYVPLGNETTDVQFGLETLGKREKVTRSS